MKIIPVLICLFITFETNAQKYQGLALTPPMGWNSWNRFACDVDEDLIKATADAMVESGMKDAGYIYVNIDDCWHGRRDSLGFIHPDSSRFPSGMKALADYIHSKGLKIGLYSDAGWQTCGGKPGSRGREFQDAMTYASWGVDYLKYDWCFTDGLRAEGAYKTMSKALHDAGRPVVLSICEWGDNQPWEWARDIGHLWRISGDIYNCFDCVIDHGTWKSWGVLQIIDMRENIRRYAGPDHWNDPDMMEIGNGMSVNEDRAHFSMWCMLAAPLIAGNDIRNMSKETLEILTNKEVIAIDQDSLGVQGFKEMTMDSVDIWYKPLINDTWAVCFLNRGKDPKRIIYNWKDHVITDAISERETRFNLQDYSIRDIWSKTNVGTTKEPINTTVSGHDVKLLQLTPVKK